MDTFSPLAFVNLYEPSSSAAMLGIRIFAISAGLAAFPFVRAATVCCVISACTLFACSSPRAFSAASYFFVSSSSCFCIFSTAVWSPVPFSVSSCTFASSSVIFASDAFLAVRCLAASALILLISALMVDAIASPPSCFPNASYTSANVIIRTSCVLHSLGFYPNKKGRSLTPAAGLPSLWKGNKKAPFRMLNIL